MYPLATVQMEDQVFKGRLPYKNGLIKCGDNDDDEDIEMASSSSESNSCSRSDDDEKCGITAL